MKKFRRRTLAIVVGLMLGWYCAGLVGDGLPSFSPQARAEQATPGAEAPPSGSGHEPSHNHDATAGDDHGEEPHGDAGTRAAGQLVPDADDIPFFRPVVTTIIALFGAAVVIGIISRSFGLKDPGAAALEHDQEAAAHHDDHGDGHDADHGEHAKADHGHH